MLYDGTAPQQTLLTPCVSGQKLTLTLTLTLNLTLILTLTLALTEQAQQLVDRLADSVAQLSQPSNGAQPVQGEARSSGASAAAVDPAVLLCGDFNAEPQSAELQVPCTAFRDPRN